MDDLIPMPRFVILQHDHPTLHWDLMLEAGEVLWTWRLEAPPSAGTEVAAERTFDHRVLYLDYEGPISGGRGSVRRWDGGQYTWVTQADGLLVVGLSGQRLRGELTLREATPGRWQVGVVP